jgi:hypothetical protein
VGFTPDGHRALSGTSHGGLRLWDLHAATAEAHGSTALSAAAGGSGEENLVDLTQDSLVDWIDENREVPLLTCQQRVHYGIAPYCDGTGRPPSDDD